MATAPNPTVHGAKRRLIVACPPWKEKTCSPVDGEVDAVTPDRSGQTSGPLTDEESNPSEAAIV